MTHALPAPDPVRATTERIQATVASATAITEKMRDRLPSKDRARLVIREGVLRVLWEYREGFEDHEKLEVDMAALDHAEGALWNSVDHCQRTLRNLP